MTSVFNDLVNKLKRTNSEEDLKMTLIYYLGKINNDEILKFKYEKNRTDVVYKDIVIETKSYGRITNKNFDEWDKQIRGYMKTNEYPYGVLFDGKRIYFYEMNIQGEITIKNEDDYEFNYKNFEKFINLLFFEDKLSKNKFLIPQNLINDFGDLKQNQNIRKFLQKLLKMLDQPNKKKDLFFKEWEKLFRLSEADNVNTKSVHEDIEKRRNVLSEIFGINIDENNEYKALFILHTALSIILKLLIYTTLLKYRNETTNINELKQFFKNLENGLLFESLGVTNMGKADFFSWYIDLEWDEDFSNLIKNIYNLTITYQIPKWENFIDPLKALYENFIDFDIRHSLGEYYTPQGLADYLVSKTVNINDKCIDPTCGSGTFLIALLKYKLKSRKTIEEILNNYEVVGIDLNPIAVLMAKLNYLLIIHRHSNKILSSIEIPVYLGDSSYMPEIENNIIRYSYYFGENSDFEMPEIVFPIEFVRSKKFIQILNQVEEKILEYKDKNEILRYLFKEMEEITEIEQTIKEKISELIEKIIYYHSKNLNTIWLFIFMNYLKPFALAPFDVAIGNPPWVRWSVLPTHYKNQIKSTLREEGIFSSDKNVGGIDLNICALIAFRVLQNLIKVDGKLIFLMPDGILANRSFEGFRKLKLSDDTKGEITKIFKPTNPEKVFLNKNNEKSVTHPFIIMEITKKEN